MIRRRRLTASAALRGMLLLLAATVAAEIRDAGAQPPAPAVAAAEAATADKSMPAKGKGKGKGARAKAKGSAGPDAPEQAGETVRSALPPELTDYFPVGRSFYGVVIPSYAGDLLKSVMTADTVTRIDERFLDLFNLEVKVYNAAGEHEATISMDEAAYDLVADELTSKTPATIEQPRFTMTGETLVHQNQTQVSHLVGDVLVVIPDARQISPTFGLPGERSKDADTP